MNIANLYQLYLNHPKVFTDSRLASHGGIFVALKGDRFDGNDYAQQALNNGADLAIIDNPDLSNCPGCFFVENTLEALQQLANFHRKQLDIPIIAITGTNGKTTTKELTAKILGQKYSTLATKGNLNNHIGVPLTLLEITPQHEIAIIEMGANHPGEIEALCKIAEPTLGLITNVGKAHLEGFGSFEGVIKTKGELYQYLIANKCPVVINTQNPYLTGILPSNAHRLSYAIEDTTADLCGEIAANDLFITAKMLFNNGWLYIKSQISGIYNLENMLAAARIGLHFQVDPLQIKTALEQYQPQNNRSQVQVTLKNKILIDCYNANPTSMKAAIENFMSINKPDKMLVLGDMLELGEVSELEHQSIVDLLDSLSAPQVYLVGQHMMITKTPTHYKKFTNVNELIETLKSEKIDSKFILIKGSRGIALEKCVEFL